MTCKSKLCIQVRHSIQNKENERMNEKEGLEGNGVVFRQICYNVLHRHGPGDVIRPGE